MERPGSTYISMYWHSVELPTTPNQGTVDESIKGFFRRLSYTQQTPALHGMDVSKIQVVTGLISNRN